MIDELSPVIENRAYVKGKGTCVNIDSSSYNSRLRKLKIEKSKDERISKLEDELQQMKDILQLLLNKGE